MEKRKLGKTDLEVTRLSFGGLFVSSVGGKFEQAREALLRGLDLGVNYIDTAPSYANSEEVIGKALADEDVKFYLSTKLGGRPDPFEPRNKDHLRQSLEESLRLLGRDHIDVLFVHEPDRPGMYDWFESWNPVEGPVCDFLEEVKDEGLVRHTGLGGTTAYELAYIMEHGTFDVVLTAFNYSILWQEAKHGIIPTAKEKGMGVVAGSPLQQGWFARRYDDIVENDPPPWLSPQRRGQLLRLYSLLDEIDMPLPELALRFALSNPDIDTVLMGARNTSEVEQNVQSAEDGTLPDDILAAVQEIAAMVPFRPWEEPAGCRLRDPNYRGTGRMR
ncbi:MAG: aldo/keto reductase [Candidatus Brocadiia bacterium]